ncbi:unnamed protein product [Nezara viridula]|uniref:EGF-like domain-containing protein n=1 Tax=Nezara viridula TaxID=85310 RepID=A0A9P0HG13_NEZVI|nr:unnamed protein product [Nezara viridula]
MACNKADTCTSPREPSSSSPRMSVFAIWREEESRLLQPGQVVQRVLLWSWSCLERSFAHRFTGTQCEVDIDECQMNPCMNGGICNDLINSFKCTCPIGFTGSRCQTNIDDCLSSPCRNGGVCRDSIAGYTCDCHPGFTG